MAEQAAQETPVTQQGKAPPADTTSEVAGKSPVAPNPLLDKPLNKAAPITMIRFGLESEYNQPWRATVPEGVTPEHTLDQGYWANISMHLNPGDTITVKPDDGTWKQILEVIGCGKLYAHVVQLHLYDLQPSEPIVALPSIYKIEHAGAHHKWRVLREGQPLRDGFRTRSEAATWAANHEGAVSR